MIHKNFKFFLVLSLLFSCFLRPVNAQKPSLFINELVALDHQMVHDVRGEYDDWIELYNGEDTAICVAGYFLTDDFKKPKKAKINSSFKQFTTIPPKGHLILWLDKGTLGRPPIHVELKLNGNGEQLGLFSPEGILIDSITFGSQKPNISYARLGDGSLTWGFANKATPGEKNVSEQMQFANKPKFNVQAGFYNEPVSLIITGSKKKDTILYTLDGTSPSKKNGSIYNKPILIDTTSVVRAVILSNGKFTSFPVTQSYFINTPFSLPVFSFVTDSLEVLNRTTDGVYFKGENPVHLEYFNQRKQLGFSLNAGFRLLGAAIIYYPQKSIAVRTRTEYGQKSLKYPLFSQKLEVNNYHDFILRNSGNDNNRTLFRDGLMQSLVSTNTHIDYLAYQPVVVYLNGDYWGIHNLREKVSRYYIKGNHPEASNKIDMLEFKQPAIRGDDTSYNSFLEYVESNDLSNEVQYDSVTSLMDVDNFIDYVIAETYFANTDWPLNNIKYWRPRKKGGKWRWIMFDLDLAFELNKSRCPGHHNSIKYMLGINNCHLPLFDSLLWESTLLFRKLIQNEQFEQQFLNRYVDLLNSNFQEERVIGTIEEIKGSLTPEIDRHIKRWSSKRGIRNVKTWNTEINQLLRFASERPDSIRHFLTKSFDIGSPLKMTFQINDSSGGTIQINSIVPEQLPFQASFFEKLAITVTAMPKKGYRFKEWAETGKSKAQQTFLPSNGTLTAIFIKQ